MSLGSYSIFAGIMSLIGLLTIAPEQPRQKQANETETPFIGTNESQQQLESRRQPVVGPDSSPTREAVTTSDKAGVREGTKKSDASTTLGAAPHPELIAALSVADQRKLTLLDKAYLDAFSILREDNACSRFYGGPAAIEALNKLTLQLKPSYLDRTIALRMKGTTSMTSSYTSGFTFRLFQTAELNIAGPFYKSSVLPSTPKIFGIGDFPPNTREARVTILLHELGHLIQKASHEWVLPDDGRDISLSQQNTMRVLSVCGEQIKRLSGTSFEEELMTAQAGVKPYTGAAFTSTMALEKAPTSNQ